MQVSFPRVSLIQSCPTSSFLVVTHSTTQTMRLCHLASTTPPWSLPRSLQTTDTTPFISGREEQRYCGLSVHPDVGSRVLIPQSGSCCVDVLCSGLTFDGRATSVALLCHAQLHYASERRSASQVFGGGTPQRGSPQSDSHSQPSFSKLVFAVALVRAQVITASFPWRFYSEHPEKLSFKDFFFCSFVLKSFFFILKEHTENVKGFYSNKAVKA